MEKVTFVSYPHDSRLLVYKGTQIVHSGLPLDAAGLCRALGFAAEVLELADGAINMTDPPENLVVLVKLDKEARLRQLQATIDATRKERMRMELQLRQMEEEKKRLTGP